jgi:hypothetical protein
MKNSGWGRSRFDPTGPGLPASELWGRAQKDAKHATVLTPDGRWVVTVRGTGREVKEWGDGWRTREVR